MNDQRTVLVTGATGNVGPHAVAQLLAAGVQVRALVLADDPNLGRLPAGVRLCTGDLARTASTRRWTGWTPCSGCGPSSRSAPLPPRPW
ncbi:NAD-dependent epimerase/dehydratase family protein [Plantactinospora sp. KBS50]|uniref:NAD-dependent epimerase/dehydratase family protein n=1 Tax=Plantactinospora sp. KBS50 TaxID=2024580 RepID=UPI00351865C4